MDKAFAVTKRLDAPTQLRLVRLAPKFKDRLDQPEVKALIEAILPLSVEEAAKYVVDNIDDIEKRLTT